MNINAKNAYSRYIQENVTKLGGKEAIWVFSALSPIFQKFRVEEPVVTLSTRAHITSTGTNTCTWYNIIYFEVIHRAVRGRPQWDSPFAMVVESVDAFVAIATVTTPFIDVKLAKETKCLVRRRPSRSLALFFVHSITYTEYTSHASVSTKRTRDDRGVPLYATLTCKQTRATLLVISHLGTSAQN